MAKAGRLNQTNSAERLDLLRRMHPEWPFDKFREALAERVRDKDMRSRDRSLNMQFLLVLTDEQDLDEQTLARYLGEVSVPRLRNFDAIYLMGSYVPSSEAKGHYPLFEVPVSGA